MFDIDNEKGFDMLEGLGDLDLGSSADEFISIDDAPDMSLIFDDKEPDKTEEPKTTEQEEKKTEVKVNEGKTEEVVKEADSADTAQDSTADLFEAAIAKAETKQAESVKNGLTDKLPVFSYANVNEEIVDTSKTFEQLRDEKAEDFPELDDGNSVSWKMVYGTVTKHVTKPNKTTIASLKKEIEGSKTFLDSLKKVKGEVTCKVTPTISAKKKGTAYKGVYKSVNEADKSGKHISFVPAQDGNVYEIRKNSIGTFIAKTDKVSMLDRIKPGFIPALPKISYYILSEVIAFFKSYINDENQYEALVYIYWSVKQNGYCVYVPEQTVSKTRINATLPSLDDDNFILVMEIHSHNTMPAVFSPTDNADEKATRLYTVIGRLDKVFPDIKTRISVGGKYVEIEPSEVFEGVKGRFNGYWSNNIKIATSSAEEVSQ